MRRRTFLEVGFGLTLSSRLMADMRRDDYEAAIRTLQESVDSGLISAAALAVRHQGSSEARSFGLAANPDAIFLLASITKPMAIAAVMSLYDQGHFDLEDPLQKHIPEFRGDHRDAITMRHLMSHVSGLPDQLPENAELRSRHAPLDDFIQGAIHTPLLFKPGAKYSYSSMGILLATEVAQRLSGKPIATLVDEVVFQPLEMKHSALGIGQLQPETFMHCQVAQAAPESGGGEKSATSWDWNSDYWRRLGSPWGGAHGSAPDVTRFLTAFLHPQGELLRPKTAKLMTANQNRSDIRARGLGFELGKRLGGSRVSENTFGHGGSTGTICWADPETDTVCVVLTTLPADAVRPHPRNTVAEKIAQAVHR